MVRIKFEGKQMKENGEKKKSRMKEKVKINKKNRLIVDNLFLFGTSNSFYLF